MTMHGQTIAPRRLPFRALVLSSAALSIPLTAGVVYPDWTGEEAGVLLWLTALLPAFLLTYYKGWQGASLGLALGMAVLSTSQVILIVTDVGTPNWSLVFGIVLAYMGICFGIGWVAELLHHERRKAENMALTDALTELPNRRHTTIFLDAAFAAAGRGTPLSIVLFDLDHFKEYNDSYGHQAGDRVLQSFAAILRGISRRMNLVARFGGEEFIGVLSACDTEGAAIFTERVLRKLRATPFRGRAVTASVGIASYEKGMGTPDLLVAAADRALYAAKRAGRDRVRAIREGRIFEPPLPTRAEDPGRSEGEGEGARAGAGAGGGASAFERGSDVVGGSGGSGGAGTGVADVAGDGLAGPPKMRPAAGASGSAAAAASTEVASTGRGSPGGTAEEGRPPLALARDGERLLVVDDDYDSRTSVTRLLRRLGYEVIEEEDGEAAIARLQRLEREKRPIDLLVADLIMPGMSGFTMVERMTAARPALRVLYMSGLLHHDVTWEGAPGFVSSFLGKPMMIDELARKVREVIDAPGPLEGERRAVSVAS